MAGFDGGFFMGHGELDIKTEKNFVYPDCIN